MKLANGPARYVMKLFLLRKEEEPCTTPKKKRLSGESPPFSGLVSFAANGMILFFSVVWTRCSWCLMASPSSASESGDPCGLRRGFCPLVCQVPDAGHLGSFRNCFSFLGFLNGFDALLLIISSPNIKLSSVSSATADEMFTFSFYFFIEAGRLCLRSHVPFPFLRIILPLNSRQRQASTSSTNRKKCQY